MKKEELGRTGHFKPKVMVVASDLQGDGIIMGTQISLSPSLEGTREQRKGKEMWNFH